MYVNTRQVVQDLTVSVRLIYKLSPGQTSVPGVLSYGSGPLSHPGNIVMRMEIITTTWCTHIHN